MVIRHGEYIWAIESRTVQYAKSYVNSRCSYKLYLPCILTTSIQQYNPDFDLTPNSFSLSVVTFFFFPHPLWHIGFPWTDNICRFYSWNMTSVTWGSNVPSFPGRETGSRNSLWGSRNSLWVSSPSQTRPVLETRKRFSQRQFWLLTRYWLNWRPYELRELSWNNEYRQQFSVLHWKRNQPMAEARCLKKFTLHTFPTIVDTTVQSCIGSTMLKTLQIMSPMTF